MNEINLKVDENGVIQTDRFHTFVVDGKPVGEVKVVKRGGWDVINSHDKFTVAWSPVPVSMSFDSKEEAEMFCDYINLLFRVWKHRPELDGDYFVASSSGRMVDPTTFYSAVRNYGTVLAGFGSTVKEDIEELNEIIKRFGEMYYEK